MNRALIVLLLFCLPFLSYGQYLFEGQVNPADWNGKAYLSEITDYRKFDGVFNEQLIQSVPIDSNGIFKFRGDALSAHNAMYRIHVDRCATYEQEVNHFTGNCEESMARVFIANNRDTIALPKGFDQEIFCEVISTNEATTAVLKVDSLMDAMKYEFVGLRAEASINKLLDDWFGRIHSFGSTQDPLVGLYIYARLTDRSTIYYDHYLKVLPKTGFYDELRSRLTEDYPDSELSLQYIRETQADQNMAQFEEPTMNILIYLGIALLIFVVGLGLWILRKRPGRSKAELTPQEKRVLDLIKENKTNKEIATELFISHSTVKSHVNNIYRKLGVTSRAEIKSLKIR